MAVISELLVKMGIDSSEVGGGMAATSKLIIAGAAVAAAGATKALYEIGSTFDDVSDGIRVKTGETGAALEGLTSSAEKVATTIPASFEDAGTTVADLNQRLGLTGPVLEKLSSQFLEAGRITGEALDPQAFTSAFNVFEVKGAQTTKVMDEMFRTSQDTGVGMNDLASMVAANAPALKGFGFGLSDSVSLLGNLDKAGLNPTKTVAGLSKAMVTFAKDGKEPQGALRDTITQVENFIKTGDQAGAINLASSIFGTKGATQFVTAVKSGAVSVDALMGTTRKGGDTILKASRDTQDFSEKWEIFKNKILLKLKPLALAVFDAIGMGMNKVEQSHALDTVSDAAQRLVPILTSVGSAVASVAGFFAKHKTIAIALVAGIAALTAVTYAHALAVGISSGALKAWALQTTIVSTATKVWTAVQWALNASILANPVTWIVVGIIALVAVIVLIATKTTWFQDIWATVWGAVKAVAASVASFFTSTIPAAFDTVWNAAQKALGWLKSNWPTIVAILAGPIGIAVLLVVKNWDKITAATQAAWNKVKSLTSAVWSAVVGYIKAQISAAVSVVSGISQVPGIVKNAFEQARSAVADKIKAVVSLAKGLPGKVTGALGDLGGLLLDTGRSIIQGLIDGITEKIHVVQDKLRELTNMIPDWKGPARKDASLLTPAGQAIIDGLVDGIESRFGRVENVLGNLTDRIAKMVDSKKLSKKAGRAAQDIVDAYSKKLDKLSTRYDNWKSKLDEQKSKLDQMVSDRESMASGLSGSLQGEMDLGSLVTTTENPVNQFGFGGGTTTNPVTFEAVSSMVSSIAARISKFAGKLKALLRMGIPKGLVQEVSALGSEKGIAVADALLSGSSAQVKQLKIDYSSFTSAADTAGDVLGGAFYDVGIKAQEGIVQGLLDDGGAIEQAAVKLGDKIVKKLKKKFKIHSPSRLMAAEIGAPAGQGVAVGLIGGLDGMQSDVDARIAALASVPSAGAMALTQPGVDLASAVNGLSATDLEQILAAIAGMGVQVDVGIDRRTQARIVQNGTNELEKIA